VDQVNRSGGVDIMAGVRDTSARMKRLLKDC